MSVDLVKSEGSFANRLSGYLQDADYRIAASNSDRDEIYKLRYECYLREEAIHTNEQQRFADDYDQMDNCWIFGVHVDGKLVSSIRLHVISPTSPYGPAVDIYPEIVRPLIARGMTLVDPTRLVVSNAASKLYLELPFATMRVACMASEFFNANYCFATVRAEHQAFYRRVFKFKPLCVPRPYPTLLKPLALLAGDMAHVRNDVAERYPIFVSSFTERRMLLEQPKSEQEIAQLYKDAAIA